MQQEGEKRARFQHTKYSNTVFYFHCSDEDWKLIQDKFQDSQDAKQRLLVEANDIWNVANDLMDKAKTAGNRESASKYLNESIDWKHKADAKEKEYFTMLRHPQFGIEEFVKLCAERGIKYRVEYEHDYEKGFIANLNGKHLFKTDPLCKPTK